MAEPHFAVVAIVLNWNGRGVLGACVQSLCDQTYENIRILVVDNASSDGSACDIKSKYPDIDVLQLAQNGGFGAGNNAGIRSSTEPYILIVNNDTILDPACVSHLVAAMQHDEQIGSVAAKIVLVNPPNRIDAAGITICPDGLAIGRGRMEPSSDYAEACDVFFASDCCCLLRRDMLSQTGLYDEDFFAYAEVTDLGWRAHRAGWRSVYIPDACVMHHHSASSGSHSPFKALLVERNRIWVAVKNFPVPMLLAGFGYTLRRYVWQAASAINGKGRAGAFACTYSKTALILILVKAYAQALIKLPVMLTRRRRVLKIGTLTYSDCIACLKAYGITARQLAMKD